MEQPLEATGSKTLQSIHVHTHLLVTGVVVLRQCIRQTRCAGERGTGTGTHTHTHTLTQAQPDSPEYSTICSTTYAMSGDSMLINSLIKGPLTCNLCQTKVVQCWWRCFVAPYCKHGCIKEKLQASFSRIKKLHVSGTLMLPLHPLYYCQTN